MGKVFRIFGLALLALLLVWAVGCKKADSGGESPAVSGTPTAAASPEAAPATGASQPADAAAAGPKKSAYDQTKGLDWTLTPERRAAIEQAIPEAKGFVDGMAIIQEIRDKKITDKKKRIQLFLAKAKGKYIFFAVQCSPNPFNENANLNLIFSEEGLMPDFLMVNMIKPKDLDTKKYKEKYGDEMGYVSPFLGVLKGTDSLTLEPAFDLLLPGIWK